MTRSFRVVSAGLQLLVAGPLFAQQTTSFTVGTATAAPGKTAYGALVIPAGADSATNVPVAVIRGARSGPVVAFVAGSHGTEYSSIVEIGRAHV